MAGRLAAHPPGEPALSALLPVELPLSLEAQRRGPRGGHSAAAGQARTSCLEHRGAWGGAGRQTDAAPYNLPGNRTVPRGGKVGTRGQSPGSAGQGGRSSSPVMGPAPPTPALMEAVKSVPLLASLGGLVLPCEMGSGPSQHWVCSGDSSGCFPGLKRAHRHTHAHTPRHQKAPPPHASHFVSRTADSLLPDVLGTWGP